MNYQTICLEVADLTREVGAFVKQERKKFDSERILTKGKNDFVTYVDMESERRLVAGLQKIFPQAGFITEEKTIAQKTEQCNWIIDPIDGTTNFIHGLPPHAISVALYNNEIPIVGVVFEIVLEECFYSWHDADAYLNGTKIQVSKSATIADSLIATGFPYNDYSRMDSFVETMKYFFTHSHGLRRIGSAATDLVYVACGRFDAFYEYSLKPWDVAAGAFIVKQAGGNVCDFSGKDNFLSGGEIIASNLHIFDQMKEEVGSRMKQ